MLHGTKWVGYIILLLATRGCKKPFQCIVTGREKAGESQSSQILVSVLRMWRSVCHLLAAQGSKRREGSRVFVNQCWLCTEHVITAVHKMHEFADMPHPNPTYVESFNPLVN